MRGHRLAVNGKMVKVVKWLQEVVKVGKNGKLVHGCSEFMADINRDEQQCSQNKVQSINHCCYKPLTIKV